LIRHALQTCPANLPGRLARQTCPADFLTKTQWHKEKILFSKCDFYFIKCGYNWQKLTKKGNFRFFCKISFFEYNLSKTDWATPRPEKRENNRKSLKIGQFLSTLANFIHILRI
jgi:hypothetical protein